jgi:glyoxylase-like metal-dependent hydrolase (beta-lactamase superfamily II)
MFSELLPTSPEPLPFAPSQSIRSYLLQRDGGNVLLYSTTGLAADADAIADRGGIARHYLNHRHEAMFSSDWVEAPLLVHESERAAVERSYRVRATFTRRHTLDDDLEVIPTPGHTPGATAYLWDSGEHRFLFTGDTIYLDGDEWVAAVLDSSDRDTYLESLELMRDLEFDVLVPWAASAEPYAVTDPADARSRIDAILARVRRGDAR